MSIDGPVAMNDPELASQHIREIPGNRSGTCTQANSTACLHGTFVTGILSAKRGSVAPAICPNCTLLVRPIFAETVASNGEMPSAMPEELAQAILDCIDAGARVLNISAAPRSTLRKKRACVRRGSGSGCQARGNRDCGGGQSGDPWQHCHHLSPVGYTSGGL
jgi:hypothetical protein